MFAHTGHVMTLANSIIGVGILAMPFCFQKCGIVLAILLLIVSNWITRICCHYLIKCSLLTRRKSFEFLGLHAFGPSGKLLAELCIIGYLVGNCITYFVVVGDLGPQIVAKLFALDDSHQHLRTIVMFVVTILCILPLGMLRNVDSLSTLSAASIGFYVCLVIKIVLESELHIIANDWPTQVLYWEPAGVLQCLPIFSMALSCQMQIFEVFESINNQSLEKLNGIVRNATWICTCVYIAVGFFGYVAFCTQTFGGNILINLSPSFGSDIMKIGFVLSIAFSFPLVIFPCRASIYSLLYRKGHIDSSSYIPEPRFRAITIFIVGLSLCIALMIPSVELIIGLVGSTIGVAICIMFPASSFRKIIKKDSTERMLAQFILIGGFCLMILGTFANLNAIDEQSSGTHLEVANNMEQSLFKPPTPVLTAAKVAELEMQLKKSEILKNFDAVEISAKINEQSDKVVKAAVKQPEPPLPVDESNSNVNKLQEKPLTQEKIVKKLEEEEIEKSAKVKELKKENVQAELVEAVPNAKEASEDAQPMPPLPVAEEHEAVKSSNSNDLKSVEQPKPLPDALPSKVNRTLEKDTNIGIQKPSMAAPAQLNQTAQQSIIDKAAIKKEEDIVAEEQKENKDKDYELKKTQNELKKTKELLERTVDELKEELAKQNQETQHLVAEKLGEVVEKVEQIERKVQKDTPQKAKEQQSPPSPSREPPPIKVVESVSQPSNFGPQPAPSYSGPQPAPLNANNAQPKPKGSLLNILADSVHARDEQEAHAGVYEPLSYKTGEKMKNNSGLKLDGRLPIPLALQRNISELKTNEIVLDAAKESVKEQSSVNETIEKENVDAIRRDLLQVKSASGSDATNPPSNSVDAAQLRVRRDASVEVNSNADAQIKKTNDNCLPEPKLDKPLSGLMEAALQIENIGRELKSYKEEDAK